LELLPSPLATPAVPLLELSVCLEQYQLQPTTPHRQLSADQDTLVRQQSNWGKLFLNAQQLLLVLGQVLHPLTANVVPVDWSPMSALHR